LDQVIKTVFGLVLRVVLLLAGLVVLASLLAAALLLLTVWLLRATWARLTGQPVSPWSFRFDREAMVNRFYRARGQGRAPRDEVSDVIDAEIKEVKDVKSLDRRGDHTGP
jgi:hypothetical protein